MDLVFRTVAVFLFVFLVTRLIGRRELGMNEPFDLILLVVLGDLVQQGITQSDYSVTGVFIVISTMALLTAGFSYAAFRVKRLRPLLEGEPLVLVDDGKPVARNLRRQRIDVDEVLQEARLQQVASLEEIRWAILEPTGQISVIPRSG